MSSVISKNPTAKHNYFIEDTIEAGIGYHLDEGKHSRTQWRH